MGPVELIEPKGLFLERILNRERLRECGITWLTFVIIAILYIGASFQPVIYDETEGQYAGAAREMLARGNWIVPTNNGVPRFQKPPLVYWALMAFMRVFGVNEFAARIPNALAAIGWLWATFLLGKSIGGWKLGWFAVLLLASACGFFVFCHLIMPEPFLACFITFAFWCLVSAWHEPEKSKKWFCLAWVFMALGTLSKGIHGAFYPLLSVGICVLVDKSSRSFWSRLFFSWRGVVLFMVIVIPWYYAVERRYPGFIWDQLMNEQLGHSLDKRWPPTSNRVDLGIFIVQHLFFLMPAALFLPAAWRSWHRNSGNEIIPSPSIQRLLIAWLGVTFLTAIISARQDYYTMSVWSVVILWLAIPWVSEKKISRWFFMIPCLLLALGGMFGLAGAHTIQTASTVREITVVPVEERDHLWTAIQGFSLNSWRTFLPLIFATSLSLFLGGVIGIAFAWKGKKTACGVIVSVSMMVPLLMAGQGFAIKENYFSLYQIAQKINVTTKPETKVFYHGEPNLASSLFFYLNRQVHWVGARSNADFAPRKYGIGRELYFTEEEFVRQWQGSNQVVLITEESLLANWKEKLELTPQQATELTRSGTRIAIENVKKNED